MGVPLEYVEDNVTMEQSLVSSQEPATLLKHFYPLHALPLFLYATF
jgi:hypothetical protein